MRQDKEPEPCPKMFKVGQDVTGAKRLISHGWQGQVRKVEDSGYIWVWWRERAMHPNELVRGNPVIGHWPDDLLPVSPLSIVKIQS